MADRAASLQPARAPAKRGVGCRRDEEGILGNVMSKTDHCSSVNKQKTSSREPMPLRLIATAALCFNRYF